KNAGKIPVLPPGAKGMLPTSPREMDYSGSTEQLRDMNLSLFGLSPAVVGINKEMTFGSVEAAQAAACTFAINPILTYIGQLSTATVASRYPKRPRMWWDDCTPDNPAQINSDLITDAAVAGVAPNDVRRLRGREPYASPEAENPLVPVGTAPYPFNEPELSIEFSLPPRAPAEDQPAPALPTADRFAASRNGHTNKHTSPALPVVKVDGQEWLVKITTRKKPVRDEHGVIIEVIEETVPELVCPSVNSTS
ncbi:MAG: hypothetical protein ACREUU_18685, partial [Gammaproteobacteria bacterium]